MTTDSAGQGPLERQVRPQWTPASDLPPRYRHEACSVVVLAVAETGDGCFQITPAKVAAMSKQEWREVRFDHDGIGRKLVVRCWMPMPNFPHEVPSAPNVALSGARDDHDEA